MAEKRRRRGMDLGRVLLWSAVIVEAPRWAGAMLAADLKDIYPWLSAGLNTANILAGVAMGIVNVVATAYMLDAMRRERPTIMVRRSLRLVSPSTEGLRQGLAVRAGRPPAAAVVVEKANWRFYGMLVFVVGLLALTPFVLAPFMVSRMTGETLEAVLGTVPWRYVWATTVVLAPIFVIGGVSFSQPGLVSLGGQPLAASEEPELEGTARGSDSRPSTFGKWRTWRKVPDAERRKIAGMNVDEVMAAYGTEERTAYNWLRDARALVGEAPLAAKAEIASSREGPAPRNDGRGKRRKR